MFEQSLIFVQIVLIDIVMAADNAIIIGLIAASFAPANRKKIIAWGIAAAFIFRVIFALAATTFLEFAIFKLIGGVLLIWVINNLRQDLFNSPKIRSPEVQSSEHVPFRTGVIRVLIADITLSLDNVLGVAGAAKEYTYLLVVGLFLSVIMIGTFASYFAEYIKNHKWVGYLGLIVILIVALQLIIGGLVNLNVITINAPFEKLFTI